MQYLSRFIVVIQVLALAIQQTNPFSVGGDHVNTRKIGHTLSTSHYAATIANAEGCAAIPFEKKKIAVFGAGGYTGAVIFGFLQRASSLYGTGIAGGPSPRAIGGTRTTADALNKVLTPCFKLAYAGEDLIRLVDSTNKEYIKERLGSFDAAILGTVYQLEQRTVTLNTYEKTPNDKTFEIYLDERYGANEDGTPNDDFYHKNLFKTAVQACKESGSIKHVVVLETPRTNRPEDFIEILEKEEISYTYVRVKSLKKDKMYSFEKGVKEMLDIKKLPKGSRIISSAHEPNEEDAVFREDVAALIVQSLMSLKWNESRILEVSGASEDIASDQNSKRKRFDTEWCPNSEVYAKLLSQLP